MSPYGTDYLSIADYTVFPALIARWTRLVPTPALHAGYATLLDAAAVRTCRYWLVDIRRQFPAGDNGIPWLINDFLPRTAARLGPTLYIAYLMAPHQLTAILSDPAIPVRFYFHDLPYRVERFTDEQAALDWLLYCHQDDFVAGR